MVVEGVFGEAATRDLRAVEKKIAQVENEMAVIESRPPSSFDDESLYSAATGN